MSHRLPDDAPIQFWQAGDIAVSLKDACRFANVTRGTMTGYCNRYAIGSKIDPTSPWRVHLVAALMIAAGNREALDAYKLGDRTSPLVAGFVQDAQRIKGKKPKAA